MQKCLVCCLAAIFLFIPILFGQSKDQTADQEKPERFEQLKNYIATSVTVKDITKKEQSFGAHKSNYLLPITWSFTRQEDRKLNEIKFQISIKQKVLEFEKFEAQFGYTQKSFWQAYDQNDSSPFRETNYNPEIFINSPDYLTEFGTLKGFFGFEHESNGERLPYSRSWDRLYAKVRYFRDNFGADYKIWYRIPEKKKVDDQDPKGDDNPNIHHYYGYGELTLYLELEPIQFSLFSRYNVRHNKGAFQIEITRELPDADMHWYAQYWNGYGESLIDYDQYIIKFGLGVIVKR